MSLTVEAKTTSADELQSEIQVTDAFFDVGYEVSTDGSIRLYVTSSNSPFAKALNFVANGSLKIILNVSGIEIMSKRLFSDPSERPFFIKLSEAFGLKVDIVNPERLPTLAKDTPLIIVANHPLNGIEGVAIAAEISKIRPDVKIILTKMLAQFPGLKENSILVNAWGGEQAKIENRQKKIEMDQHLKNGGALLIFPSGEVSQKSFKNLFKPARDPIWRSGAVQLLEKNPTAQILPIFVGGEPSWTFQVTRAIHVFLGTLFNVREIAARIDSGVELTLGPSLGLSDLAQLPSQQKMMDYLKSLTYLLARNKLMQANFFTRKLAPIIEPVQKSLVQKELLQAQVMYEANPEKAEKGIQVFLAQGYKIPNTLLELGRLREIAFRGVNEGSGQSHDNDSFDLDYYHLIAWDKEKSQISGAYRLGLLDEIMQTKGLSGIYSNSFFDYQGLLDGPIGKSAIELGRSFVAPDYQRRSLTLPALWYGIGKFLVDHPKYRYLIGPVSLSADYKESSKDLICSYLKKYYSPIEEFVRPRHPVEFNSGLDAKESENLLQGLKTIKDVDHIVKSIEGAGQGVPPLIKLYLNFNTQFLAFDHDKDFNTIDGLILTDLVNTPLGQLKKYLGDQGAEDYHKYHQFKTAR